MSGWWIWALVVYDENKREYEGVYVHIISTYLQFRIRTWRLSSIEYWEKKMVVWVPGGSRDAANATRQILRMNVRELGGGGFTYIHSYIASSRNSKMGTHRPAWPCHQSLAWCSGVRVDGMGMIWHGLDFDLVSTFVRFEPTGWSFSSV